MLCRHQTPAKDESKNQNIEVPVTGGWLLVVSADPVRSHALRRVNGENGLEDRLGLGSQVRPLLFGFLAKNAEMRDFMVENMERRGIRRPLLDQEALRKR